MMMGIKLNFLPKRYFIEITRSDRNLIANTTNINNY